MWKIIAQKLRLDILEDHIAKLALYYKELEVEIEKIKEKPEKYETDKRKLNSRTN